MEKTYPQISILMAVYEPDLALLQEQLLSLNRQTYPNIKLYIREDHSPKTPFSEIKACVERCITAFPFQLERNEKNLGSNGTFEALTREADGAYFAYCDQDDMWMPEKLTVLEEKLSKSTGYLAYSDLDLIDGEGKKFADSIRTLRPHHEFMQGPNLAESLLYRNYVTGCTMLVKSSAAKESLPFLKNMYHDHYLALFCAMKGELVFSEIPLIHYRLHGNNQTGVLMNVTDRKSYEKLQIDVFYDQMKEVDDRFSLPEIDRAMAWAEARKANAERKPGGMKKLWKYRKTNMLFSMFELTAFRMGEGVFQLFLKLARSGKI